VLLRTRGVLDLVAARTALILAPCFYIGVKAGIALFAKFDERRFRQFTLMLLVAVSTVLLFL
jgi:uncharacterized membrane protein YfcA